MSGHEWVSNYEYVCVCLVSATVRATIATLTTKTMTQWLAIPTEIRLKEVPKILENQTDAVEMPAVLLDGQNVVIKQEKNDKFEMEDDEVKDNGGPYFYAMVSTFGQNFMHIPSICL